MREDTERGRPTNSSIRSGHALHPPAGNFQKRRVSLARFCDTLKKKEKVHLRCVGRA